MPLNRRSTSAKTIGPSRSLGRLLGCVLSISLGLVGCFGGNQPPAQENTPVQNPLNPAAPPERREVSCPRISDLDFRIPFHFDLNRFQSFFSHIDDSTVDHLVEFLSNNPNLAKLYHQNARVSQNYTIKEHTLRVMKQFVHQHSHFQETYRHFGYSTNYPKLMLTLLALHDIGKPCGELNSDQHQFTPAIAERTMQALGFSPKDVRLAVALVKHDPIGEFFQEQTPGRVEFPAGIQHYQHDVRLLARETALNIHEFFDALLTFYISDSSSYPNLNSMIYHENSHGALVFRSHADGSRVDYQDLIRQLKQGLSQQSQAEVMLSQLGETFDAVAPAHQFQQEELQQVATYNDFVDKLMIPSAIEAVHSGFFNYQEFFNRPIVSGFSNEEVIIDGTVSWDHHRSEFQRVIGYTFRGDKRAPDEHGDKCAAYGAPSPCGPKDMGGFWPGAVFFDANQPRAATMAVPAHIMAQRNSAYVSTTRSIRVAKHYLGNETTSYIYASLVEGGLVVPRNPRIITGIVKPGDHQEIVVPGGVPWEDVVAYRKLTNGRFDGDVFVRSGFQHMDPQGYEKIVNSLSGHDYTRHSETHHNTADILQVKHYLEAKLATNTLRPEQIMVILDVDGTLTNQSDPHSYRGHQFQPRPGAIELIQYLNQSRVNYVVSSASVTFDKTLQKLRDIHLAGELNISATPHVHSGTVEFRNRDTSSKDEFQYQQLGRIVSVRRTTGDSINIRKALAGPIYLRKPLADIRLMLLVDDNGEYIHTFEKDVEKYEVFRTHLEDLQLFHLTWSEAPPITNP